MRRLLTYLFCGVVLLSFSGNTLAVEKKQKGKPANEEVKKKTPPKKNEKGTSKKPPAKPVKKYDDFVDKNKNGIDDRRENLKKKTSKPKPKS